MTMPGALGSAAEYLAAADAPPASEAPAKLIADNGRLFAAGEPNGVLIIVIFVAVGDQFGACVLVVGPDPLG
jgi:hypothetical protein